MNFTERRAAARQALHADLTARENAILTIADELSDDDTSQAAEDLRDLAQSIRDHREEAERRAARD